MPATNSFIASTEAHFQGNTGYVLAAITSAIISMAKSLNLKVIAEGVADEAQLSFLQARGCDEIQGYYFSRPLAANDLAAKIRDHTGASYAHAAGREC